MGEGLFVGECPFVGDGHSSASADVRPAIVSVLPWLFAVVDQPDVVMNQPAVVADQPSTVKVVAQLAACTFAGSVHASATAPGFLQDFGNDCIVQDQRILVCSEACSTK